MHAAEQHRQRIFPFWHDYPVDVITHQAPSQHPNAGFLALPLD
jgi:hypothetical protein